VNVYGHIRVHLKSIPKNLKKKFIQIYTTHPLTNDLNRTSEALQQTQRATVTTLRISAGSWFQMVTTRELKKYFLSSIL